MKKITEKDLEYKKELARELNSDVNNLVSIVGVEELKELLPKYKPSHFSVGKDFENVINCSFRANMHIHSTASDGYFAVEEILEQANIYAKKSAKINNDELPPFMIAITNHDNLEDSKKAALIIAEDPEKYINLKVVLGCEFSALFDNSINFKRPLKTDYLAYAINPFDKKVNSFIDDYVSRRYLETKIISKSLTQRGFSITFDELLETHLVVKCGGSTTFFDLMRRRFRKEIDEKGLNIEYEDLLHNKQYETTPYIHEIINLIDKPNKGLSGIAHPARVNPFSSMKNKPKLSYKESIKIFIQGVKKQGASIIEGYYQYKDMHVAKNPHILGWIDSINEINSSLDYLYTGGCDSHRRNIFTHHEDLEDNDVEKLLDVSSVC